MVTHLDDDTELENIINRIEVHLNINSLDSGVLEFSWGSSVRNFDEIDNFNISVLMDEADKALYAEKQRRNVLRHS